VAFNPFGSSASFFATNTFNFDSAYLTAAWNDGLQLEVRGFVSTNLIYDNTYTLNTTNSSLINFDYLGVTRVAFIATGGIHNSDYSGTGTVFVVDNLTVDVPEPSTSALLILSGALACLADLRKKSAGRWKQGYVSTSDN
jgi:hypothetical protein